MLPAHQRLGADDRPGAGVDLGLEVQPQLALGDGAAQLRLHQHPTRGACVHLLVEEAQLRAAGSLGGVQRLFGAARQTGQIGRVVRKDRDADACRQHQRLRLDVDRLRDRVDQALRHRGRLLLAGQVGDQQREGIGAHARQHALFHRCRIHRRQVAGADPRTQPLGDDLQHGVALAAAERIVDAFEAVDVQMQHGAACAVAPHAFERRTREFGKELAVRQPGGAVVVGELADALLGQHAVGDVLRDALDAHRPPVFAGDAGGLLEHGAHGAVETLDLELQLVRRAIVRQLGASLAHTLAVGRHDTRQPRFRRAGLAGLLRRPEQAHQLRGAFHPAVCEQLPVAHAGQPLRPRQALAVAPHRLGGEAGANGVAHAVRQQGPVDRLGDEVGGAVVVRALDRLGVVQAREHQDRDARARRRGTDALADLVAVEAGHHHVQQHQVVDPGLELRQRLLAAGRIAHVEAGMPQGRRGHVAQQGVVVDDQQVGSSVLFVHTELPCSTRMSAA